MQKEIAETLSSRARQATDEYFIGKTIRTDEELFEIDSTMAKQIYRYLIKNDYTDDMDHITDKYHEDKASNTLVELPENLKIYDRQIFKLIDSVYSDGQLPKFDNGRLPKSNPLNDNFHKKEFQELWEKINRKAIYRVEFDSDELIRKCVSALNSHLKVTPLQYMIQVGEQKDNLTDNLFHGNDGFKKSQTKTEYGKSTQSRVKYDLIGKISENTVLTRKTCTAILQKIRLEVFEQFKENPEHFISEFSRIITEQKASIVIERLTYDEIDGQYGVEIFTAGQIGQDFSRATEKLRNHIYDYVIADSIVERNFVHDLDISKEVVVYAKLPRGFMIPTPIGDYRPDWAISFRVGSVRQLYFVAETKGTMSSMELRKTEEIKIDCARKFFSEIVQRIDEDQVSYDVVSDYKMLMDIVGARSTQTKIRMR